MGPLWITLLIFLLGNVEGETVYELINSRPEMSKVKGWLSTAVIERLSRANEEWTVLFPSNTVVDDFFRTYPELENNATALEAIVQYSIVKRNEKIATLTGFGEEYTNSTDKVKFDKKDGSYFVNSARVNQTDISGSNGYLNVMDEVIYPLGIDTDAPNVINSKPEYSGMKELLAKDAEYEARIDNGYPYSIFCPSADVVTDEIKALDKSVISPLLKRHTIVNEGLFTSIMRIDSGKPFNTLEPGKPITPKYMDDTLFVGSNDYWAIVTEKYSNRMLYYVVLHVINAVLGVTSGVNVYQATGLLPPSKFNMTREHVMESEDIKAKLVNLTASYTLLSPSDAAWSNHSNLNASDIVKVLNRHILPMKLTAADLMDKTEVTTLGGDKLKVKTTNGTVVLSYMGTEAEVTATDYSASNGNLHVLDAVLESSKAVGMEASYIFWIISLLCALLYTH